MILVCFIAWGSGTASGGTDESAQAASFHLDDASLPQTFGEVEKSAKTASMCEAEASQIVSPSDALCRDAFSAGRIPELYRYQYECAFVISPEIGGARTAKNTWLQPSGEVSMKRAADRELRKRVCEKAIPLAQAQKEIAEDWPAVYRRYVAKDVTVTIYESPTDAPRKRIAPAALSSSGSPGKSVAADVSQAGTTETPPIEASVAIGSDQSGPQAGYSGNRNRQSRQIRGSNRPQMASPTFGLRTRGSRPSLHR